MSSEAAANERAEVRLYRTEREPEHRSDLLSLITAVGVGAAGMYLLDPDRGRRRRHVARDKLVHAAHETGEAVVTTGRDLSNRARGIAAETRHRFESDEVDDVVLVERVRAELGRVVSHPRAIEVAAEKGRVALQGQVLTREADELIARVARVRGAKEVQDRLERHESADGIPSLRGTRRAPGSKLEPTQESWTPAARLLAGITGGALAAVALRREERRNPLGTALGAVGLALFVRSATNMPFDRLTGAGAGRRAIDVQKSINIAASIDEVFNWLLAWERWPHWMSHVREVRPSVAGHAVAALFRRDPKRQLDDDLARLKATIETGRPPHDAAARAASPQPAAGAP